MKDFWVTREGERIKYVDLDDSHLENCIKMVRRKIEGIKAKEQKECDQFPVNDILDGNVGVQQLIHAEFRNYIQPLEMELGRLTVEVKRRKAEAERNAKHNS